MAAGQASTGSALTPVLEDRDPGDADDGLAVACHTMRTPLTAAMGFVQLSLREALRQGNATQIRNLQTADQQLRRLAKIIEDLAIRAGGR